MVELTDEADWTGIPLKSKRQRGKLKFSVNGYRHMTEEEVLIAEKLTKDGVPYTPEVEMIYPRPSGGLITFVPDFVFDGLPYVWHGGDEPIVIHGIEAKLAANGKFPERTVRKVRRLKEARGICILIMRRVDVIRWCAEERPLLVPLHP